MDTAILREKRLKERRRLRKIRLIESMNPEWIDLFDERTGEISMAPPTCRGLVERGCPALCLGPGLCLRAPCRAHAAKAQDPGTAPLALGCACARQCAPPLRSIAVAPWPIAPRFPVFTFLASRRNGTLYIGVTSDLTQRVTLHKQDLIEGFTKKIEGFAKTSCKEHPCCTVAIES